MRRASLRNRPATIRPPVRGWTFDEGILGTILPYRGPLNKDDDVRDRQESQDQQLQSPSASSSSNDVLTQTPQSTTPSLHGDTDLVVGALLPTDVNRIKKAVNECVSVSIESFENIVDDENDTSGDILITTDSSIPIHLFDDLRSRLPYHSNGFKIIIDYEDGFLHVRTVPGLCHEAACRAWDFDINGWANNYTPLPGHVKPVLKPTGSGGTYFVVNILTC
jgi:hypothetical protein